MAKLASVKNITQADLQKMIEKDCEEAKMIISLASNLSRPDFKSGLQPDGSVIEI